MVESMGTSTSPQESKQEREQHLCPADQIVDVPLVPGHRRARIPQEDA